MVGWKCWEPFQILLPSEYRVPSSCIRLTFDYNLFFIYIVEQDTFNGVILKNIHIITDKYNCSQIQAIIQLFDKVLCHTLALWCFANWCFGRLWRVEKEKSEIKQTWKLNVKILLRLLSKWFRLGLARSTERVPSLAMRVAYSRWPVILQLFNWRVPALIVTHLIWDISIIFGNMNSLGNSCHGKKIIAYQICEYSCVFSIA